MQFNHAIALSVIIHGGFYISISLSTPSPLPVVLSNSDILNPVKLSFVKEQPKVEPQTEKLVTPKDKIYVQNKLAKTKPQKRVIEKSPKLQKQQKKKIPSPTLINNASPGTKALLVHAPKPPYPFRARKAGFEGEVILDVDINNSGKVTNVIVAKSSGREDCDLAALDTVQHDWRFNPVVSNNSTVQSKQRIIVEFQLN